MNAVYLACSLFLDSLSILTSIGSEARRILAASLFFLRRASRVSGSSICRLRLARSRPNLKARTM